MIWRGELRLIGGVPPLVHVGGVFSAGSERGSARRQGRGRWFAVFGEGFRDGWTRFGKKSCRFVQIVSTNGHAAACPSTEAARAAMGDGRITSLVAASTHAAPDSATATGCASRTPGRADTAPPPAPPAAPAGIPGSAPETQLSARPASVLPATFALSVSG